MAKYKMKVKFLDWKPGEEAELDNETAARYINMGVIDDPKASKRKQTKAAPVDKQVKGAAVNK